MIKDDEIPDSVAVDHSGNKIPISSDEVDATARDIAHQGKLLITISQHEDNIACHVWEPPSKAMITSVERLLVELKALCP